MKFKDDISMVYLLTNYNNASLIAVKNRGCVEKSKLNF